MSTPPRANASSRRDFLIPLVCLCLGAMTAYHNSFGGAFVFDDAPSITDNPSLRSPWSIREVLWPSVDGGATVSGRPVVNLTLALNMALGGSAVCGYHAVNFLIHLLAGLLLFGLVRRTCGLPVLAGRYGAAAQPLALAVALLWLVHPLQTESVTYIIQRTESLVGLCYLLTLYSFVRGATGGGSRWWVLSLGACWLGMATKEVMVTAPLMVFLYDRTFMAGSFGEPWRLRRGYYLGLAASWLFLGLLVVGNAGRGGTAGLGTGLSSWTYLLTQCEAIVRYLGLVIWPSPLVFDYGTGTVNSLAEVWPQALLLLGLLGATGWALWRRPVMGFLGLWFFVILAPSSSVVPVASQTMAEHRMYLPVVVPLVLAVFGLHRLAGRWSYPLFGLLALGCGWLTIARNEDYRTAHRLWSDTVAKHPANGRAHHELGKALFELGRVEESLPYYQTAIRLQPLAPEPRHNLGLALAALGRRAEAMAQYAEALRLEPDYADAHNNLGIVLLAESRLDEAEEQFSAALQARPDYAKGFSNLANVLLEQGRPADAIAPAREAVRLDPAYAAARYNLGNALAETGQWPAAAAEYEAALRLQPDFSEVHNNLANVLLQLDRVAEAIGHYEAALKRNPDYVDPRRNLAGVLVQLGRPAEARPHYEVLVRLRPDDPEIRAAFARLPEPAR